MYLLQEINTTRYDYRRQVVLSSEEAEKYGIKKREGVTVEKVYEDYKKNDLQVSKFAFRSFSNDVFIRNFFRRRITRLFVDLVLGNLNRERQ